MLFSRSRIFTVCICTVWIFAASFFASAPANGESNKDLLKKAITEYRAGDYSSSSGHFYAALTTEFNNPSIHYYMASCYVHLKDPESAVREFRIAYALSPTSEVGVYAAKALKCYGINQQDSAHAKAFLDEARAKRLSAPAGAPVAAASKDDGKPVAPPPPVSAAAAVSDQSVSLIRSQAQREKSVRLEQSQKMADEINHQATDRIDKEVSAIGARLSSDPKQREREILMLPDDIKSVLDKLKHEYDSKQERQLGLGRTQGEMLDESAANLQNLIERDHSVQAAGSNLYVRNYKKGTNDSRVLKSAKNSKDSKE